MAATATLIGGKIRFDCKACGYHVAVGASLAGRRGKCPNCGFINVVPSPSESDEPVVGDALPMPDNPSPSNVPLQEDHDGDDTPPPVEIEEASDFSKQRKAVVQGPTQAMRGADMPATGPMFMRTFVVKLRTELADPVFGAPNCVTALDRDINAWLAQQTDYELVNTSQTVGELMNKKGNENALFINVTLRRKVDG